MGRASNSLAASDFVSSPLRLRYSASYASSSLASQGVGFVYGVNRDLEGLIGGARQRAVNYRTIRHLYYQNFLTGSRLQTTSSYDNSLQSTAGSGFLEEDVRFFPTGTNEAVVAFAIPTTLFGDAIQGTTFEITAVSQSASVVLTDDGNGNLIHDIQCEVWYFNDPAGADFTYMTCSGEVVTETINSATYRCINPSYALFVSGGVDNMYWFDSLCNRRKVNVGNVIYDQGVVVVTNQDYVSIFANSDCMSYTFSNNAGGEYSLNYTDCNGAENTITLPDSHSVVFCASETGLLPDVVGLTLQEDGACTDCASYLLYSLGRGNQADFYYTTASGAPVTESLNDFEVIRHIKPSAGAYMIPITGSSQAFVYQGSC